MMTQADREDLTDDDDVEPEEKELPSEALEAEVGALEATLPAEPPLIPPRHST